MGITLQKMRNENHNAFMYTVKSLLQAEKELLQGSEQLIEKFIVAMQAEEKANRVSRKSELTRELVKLDAQRQEIYAGLLYHYESCLRHYDTGKREAAKQLSPIMKSIAHIHNKSKIERTVALWKITAIIRKEKYDPVVQTLGISGWLDALDAASQAYNVTDNKRNTEKSQRGNGNVLSTRVVTDEAYKAIVSRVNALAVVNGPEKYAALIRRMNKHIHESKRSLAISEGWRKHNKEKKLAALATQSPAETVAPA